MEPNVRKCQWAIRVPIESPSTYSEYRYPNIHQGWGSGLLNLSRLYSYLCCAVRDISANNIWYFLKMFANTILHFLTKIYAWEYLLFSTGVLDMWSITFSFSTVPIKQSKLKLVFPMFSLQALNSVHMNYMNCFAVNYCS